jgi:hypothetical protein
MLPALLAVYALPVVTLPLLAPAIALAAAGNAATAMNPLAVARITARNLAPTVVVHMALLVWLAGGLLAALLAGFARQALVTRIDPTQAGGLAIHVAATLIAAFILAAVAMAAALTAGRCVGYFGLYHRDVAQGR